MLRVILVSLAIVLLSAWLVRRLLGIRRGRWLATLIAALAAGALSIGILQLVTDHVFKLGWRWLPIGLALVVTLTMLLLALLELLARPRTRRWWAGIPHPVSTMRRGFARGTRYLQVSAIAVRNGLLAVGGDDPDPRESRLGRSLAATFEEAGGLFVKLGQAMASQPQLISPAVAAELARLQEQAAPADPGAARAVIEEDLGPPDEIFGVLPADPVAAGSIAQTYFATLRDGREVVVKVQRPDIQESIERDLDILIRLADRLHRRTTWARALGLKELVAGFAETTREELDFHIEAANCTAARKALKEEDPITVPSVMDEYTTTRILVQERVPGRSLAWPGILTDVPAEQRRTLADALLSLMMRQMVAGERYHADPHPGNVFLRPDGRLALIDFGAVGRLNRFERTGLFDIMRGLQSEDPALLRQAALRIGHPTSRIEADALDRELARLLARAFQPDGTLNPAALGDMLSVFREFGIVMPRSTTTLFRTLVTLMGTLELMSPGYALKEAIQRVGGEVMAPMMRPENLRELVQHEVFSVAPVLARLPRDIDDVARSLLRGDLRTRISLFSEPADLRAMRAMLNRLVMGIVGSALAIASAILLTLEPRSGQGAELITIIGGIGLTFAVVLLLRVVVQILRERG